MATHCSILTLEIPWTEEPGGLQSVGLLKELDKTEHLNQKQQYSYILTNIRIKFQSWISRLLLL